MAVDKVKLGIAVVKASAKALVPGLSGAADSLAEIAAAIAPEAEGANEARRIRGTLKKIANRANGKLTDCDSHFLHVPENEKSAVAVVIEQVIGQTPLTVSSLVDDGFDPNAIYGRLVEVCREAWSRQGLPEPSRTYGETLLYVCCQEIVGILKASPDTEREVAISTFLLAKRTPDRLVDVLNRIVIPKYRIGTNVDLIRFDAAYRTSVARKFGDLRQFGLLDLPSAMQWQPIDVTYISLTSSSPLSPDTLETMSHQFASSAMAIRQDRAGSVEEVVGALSRKTGDSDRGLRVAISGTAGSGKTTVLHWLATKCALSQESSSTLPPELAHLENCVPFVATLRDVSTRHVELTNDDLLGGLDTSTFRRPADWLENVLESGQALVIFDGLDEVPPAQASAVSDWIAQLCDSYPQIHVVLSARPEALDAHWLSARQFTAVELRPLDLAQIATCVDRWFDGQCDVGVARFVSAYRRRQSQLLKDLQSSPPLRDLAETPLLIALLCAYYASGATVAPAGRIELVSKVTQSLIFHRDHERDLIPREFDSLGVRRRLSLLGSIASRMFESGASSIAFEPSVNQQSFTALGLVEEFVLGTPSIGVSAEEVLHHIERRSFVFKQTGRNEAEFAHRLFMEFLAAHYMAQKGARNALLGARHMPGFYTVAAFYCSICPEHEAESFIAALSELLRSRDLRDQQDRRLILCVAECVSGSGVDPEAVIPGFKDLLGELLPPQNAEEVAIMAGLGDVLSGLLPLPRTPLEAVTSVAMSRRLRGEIGFSLLTAVSQSDLATHVLDDLVDAWDAFEPETYAQRILARLPLDDAVVVVKTPACLDALRFVPQVKRLRLLGLEGLRDLRGLSGMTLLEELDLRACRTLVTLKGIEGLTALRRIRLPKNCSLEDVDALSSCPGLHAVYIEDAAALMDMSGLRELPKLGTLHLERARREVVEQLSLGFEALVFLSVDGSDVDNLDFLSGLPNLKGLRARTRYGISQSRALGDHVVLERLKIDLSFRHSPLHLPRTGQLKSLTVGGTVRMQDLTSRRPEVEDRDGALLSSQVLLDELVFPSGVEDIDDLHMFSGNSSLRTLIVRGAGTLTSVRGIQHLSKLVTLVLTGTYVNGLAGKIVQPTMQWDGRDEKTGENVFTPVMPQDADWYRAAGEEWTLASCLALEEVNMDDSPMLGSVRELQQLPRLRKVSLLGAAHLDELDLPVHVEVLRDPWMGHVETG